MATFGLINADTISETTKRRNYPCLTRISRTSLANFRYNKHSRARMPKDKKHLLFYPHDFMSRKSRVYSGAWQIKNGRSNADSKNKEKYFSLKFPVPLPPFSTPTQKPFN